MIRTLAVTLLGAAALALALPAPAACVATGTLLTPVYTPGAGESKITLRASGTLFYTFTLSDPTLKLLIAIHGSETLRISGDAATCPATGIERAGGAILNFTPLGVPSPMSILKE